LQAVTSLRHPRHRRIQSIMAQGTDKGLDAPMPERGMLDQTQAAWCPSCGLGPVGLDRDLVDECQRPYHDCQTPLILLEWKFFCSAFEFEVGWFSGFGYQIARVYWLIVIFFAALKRFCEMAAMTICALVLATPKKRARCRPKGRFIMPKHCLTRKQRFQISRMNRF
jgi:hypothetical protein